MQATDPAFQEAGAGNVIVSLLHLYLMVFASEFIPLKEQAGGFF
jgi:hypothetical protein